MEQLRAHLPRGAAVVPDYRNGRLSLDALVTVGGKRLGVEVFLSSGAQTDRRIRELIQRVGLAGTTTIDGIVVVTRDGLPNPTVKVIKVASAEVPIPIVITPWPAAAPPLLPDVGLGELLKLVHENEKIQHQRPDLKVTSRNR